jgi:hypothetical protein
MRICRHLCAHILIAVIALRQVPLAAQQVNASAEPPSSHDRPTTIPAHSLSTDSVLRSDARPLDAIETESFKLPRPRLFSREALRRYAPVLARNRQSHSPYSSITTAGAGLLVAGITSAVIAFASALPTYSKRGCEYESLYDTPDCRKLRVAFVSLGIGGIVAALVGGFMMAGGGAHTRAANDPDRSYTLETSGFGRSMSDPAFEEALKTLGERCYGGAPASLSTPQRLPVPAPARAQATERRPIYDPADLAYLDDIEIAQYRPNRSQLIVIGPPAQDAGIRPDDFMTVLRAVSFGQVPGVSIDPDTDSTVMRVRHFGRTENTALGTSLFEADRLMKVMSTGFDNTDCSRWAGMPASMTTELQLYSDEAWNSSESNQGPEGWHRYWFEYNDNPLEHRNDQKAIRIPSVRLRISEESVPAGRPSPPSARQFAALLTQQFRDLSRRLSVFADVQRAAGMTALAKWMVDNRIPVESRWLTSTPATQATAQFTRRVSVTKGTQNGDRFLRVGIEGGVDFQKPNNYAPDTGIIATVLRAADAAAPVRGGRWDFVVQGRQYRAVRLQYERPVPLISQRMVAYSRDGGQNFPQPHKLELMRAASTLAVVNNTSSSLSVQITGQGSVSVPQGETGNLPLSLGSQLVAMASGCGTSSTTLTVAPGESYQTTVYCRDVTQTTQSVTGKLTVRNQSGSLLTMELKGPITATYTFQPGESTVDLPIGEYAVDVSLTCGPLSDSLKIQRRDIVVETYFCR